MSTVEPPSRPRLGWIWIVATRLLTDATGRVCGVLGFDCRTADFYVVRAKAVILSCGAAGRLGLPASGYLMGTYENPTNAGDGYAMAYHAGAALANLECFQINPLIKDYNGPACAYVANPFGGYQVNADGDRFVDSDYWSGQMMAEVKREIESARGPIYLKVSHLPDETLTAELHKLMRREVSMVPSAFPYRFVDVDTAEGPLRVLTFAMNRKSTRYIAHLSDEELAEVLAHAVGYLGSMAEYLFSTVSKLEELGIHDRNLWRLQELVAERIEAAHPPTES